MRKLLLSLLATVPLFAADLTGRVTGPGGKPLKGAHVYVYTAQPQKGVGAICPECYVDCGKKVTVDANGRFRIKSVDGKLRFNLLAVADGYEPAFSEYRDPGPGFDFELKPRDVSDEAHLVRGQVVDPKGKPVVGAVVHLQAVRQGKRVGYGRIPGVEWLSITNGNGEFALRVDDPTWLLDVRVEARNFGPRIARELLPGAPLQKIEVNVGATIAGRLTDGTKPLPGVRVAFAQVDRRSAGFLGIDEIGTDAKGEFVMTGLGTEVEYEVRPRMASLAPLAVVPKVVKTGADRSSADAGTLTTTRGFRVQGRVDGTKIPEVTRVTISSGVDAQIVEVQSDGRFEFTGVPAGKYSISVAVRGYRVPPVRQEVSADVENVTLVLQQEP
ncbi:MAG TPA: carboxypeptidase regulatory-like domain-containing protein [Thermoanaerobaculia bacterium]|nr:carboxypeptidase regulatory-like domain-containing protein [Thermoanaerobaculia bacterium]